MSWKEYYKKIRLEPRPSLVRALNYIKEHPVAEKTAIDLGSGNGCDTVALLDAGWKVLAIDSSPESIPLLKKNAGKQHLKNLTCVCEPFEEVNLRATYLINASYSLPFCNADAFKKLWQEIDNSLQLGGVFTGTFFGENDEWKDLLLLSRAQVTELFRNFEVIYFNEEEVDKESATGPMKHWHIFDITAIKSK